MKLNSFFKIKKNKGIGIIPYGVKFKFIVTPSLTDSHKKAFKYFFLKESGIKSYFKEVFIDFYDGYMQDNKFSDKCKGKRMQISISCPEPSIAVESEEKEKQFYKQIKDKFSKRIIEMIETNSEKSYKVKLENFLHTQELKFEQ